MSDHDEVRAFITDPALQRRRVIFLGRFVLPVEGQGFVKHSNQLC
jgi:hypothetical protein